MNRKVEHRDPGSDRIHPQNRSTLTFVRVQGVAVGTLGAIHGISAALKGFVSTNGFVMGSVGAVTVIPNYLISGLSATVVGVCIAFWTMIWIHTRSGPTVFLLLSVLLLAVGGGIAHLPFFLIGWAVSTRINASLTWWRRTIPRGLAEHLAQGWLGILFGDYVLLLIGIAIWLLFLPPGLTERSTILQYICWGFIAAGLLMQLPTVASGFMRDLLRRVAANDR
jgi:hypothetical protein